MVTLDQMKKYGVMFQDESVLPSLDDGCHITVVAMTIPDAYLRADYLFWRRGKIVGRLKPRHVSGEYREHEFVI
ncbi:MAG: hypothetical protein ABIH52_01050 [Candidatus Aenigmatarchaeota archaeon]|nr:hypothetical protein [Nanoarchaeota archaeon]